MIEFWALKKILKAFENKDVGSIRSLIVQQCINPNALIPSKGVSLLHLIIGHQSENFAFAVVKLFLRCGGDPNVQSSDGVTPIHVAAAWGRNRILHLLLVNGGDPWMQDDEKKNAFNYAFEEREWNTIEMLHRFQQMHSAASNKQDVDPKYKRSLERVLLRRGQEMFAFAPSKKSVKSTTTQTQIETPASSPVQDKIRYFEPPSSMNDEISCQRESNKNFGWLKDFYQTSCEVVVHQDASEKEETEEKKEETFVSSIHINTSPASESGADKSDQSSMNVRGQLFVELQEAVRRRSKLKMLQEEQVVSTSEKSGVSIEDDPTKDSFVAKEVSYLYGVNLEESRMLKNMSDFATKVMNEIEVTEADPVAEKTIDLCVSSPDLTGTYLSCEDEVCRRKSDVQDIQTFLIPQSNSNTSNLYLTPYDSEVVATEGKEENSNESFTSVAEEYKYTDAEEGVVLLEKKLVVTPTISFDEGENLDGDESASSVSSTVSTVPSSLSYNSEVLRCELNGLGYNPGPITTTTKKLYLRKLWRLKKNILKTPAVHEKDNMSPVHSPVVERTLADSEVFKDILKFRHLEEEMVRSFETWTKRKWREGTNKTSFNYLLLDPRSSLNLPKRASEMTDFDAWKCFLSGVFYVGKGKRSRPYAHLYKAIAAWEKRSSLPLDDKTVKIIEIWKEGLGVVCLQVFQNIIPVEALTREAAMIDALGISSLKNVRAGEYYGVASTWPTRDKIRLGTYLLYKAMLIFINEGERQIKPYDID